MENYELGIDEVILFEDEVTHNKLKERLKLTLNLENIKI